MPVILYIIFYDKVRRKLCRTMHTLSQQVLRAVHGLKYLYDKVRHKLCRTLHTLPQPVLRAVHVVLSTLDT